MKKLVVVLVLFLSGCGTVPKQFMQTKDASDLYEAVPNCPIRALAYVHDMNFSGYLGQFQRDARKHDVGCYRTQAMYFDDEMPSDRTLAYCVPGSRIVVHRKKWLALSDIEQKTLIYHELGHCALNLDHAGEKDIDIMAPDILYPEVARNNWRKLVTQLFRKAQEEQR